MKSLFGFLVALCAAHAGVLGLTLNYITVNSSYTFPYASSVDITTSNPSIKTVFMVIHGIAGDVQTSFGNMVALTSYDSSIAVVAPYFACDKSIPIQANTLMWDCNGWQEGDPSAQLSSIYSFSMADRLLQIVRSSFANLGQVYVVGYSAGGQFVQRYLGGSTVALSSKLNTNVGFVVGAPGSFMYLDTHRVKSGISFKAISNECNPSGCSLSISNFTTNYNPSPSCPGYDQDKYGLSDVQTQVPFTYLSQFTAGTISTQYQGQSVTYMVGSMDTAVDSILDTTCPAQAQGENRLQRSLVFNRYLQLYFPQAWSAPQVVVGCTHDELCVFRSSQFAAATKLTFQNLPSSNTTPTSRSMGVPRASIPVLGATMLALGTLSMLLI
ncbi:uncharacterized protein BJ171DRAFT_565432 [Polychytrium aggregatum]|uniref:uncharacterized protein n=1 Tax=Polychytrium aggregatum TaxID=110093 RepID=UPI0022FE2DD0|nr:uncharacterized protein BJ171DRAFT_565432 [Polychytrium aggregatum]KAI9208302.1 hypothetical protein BJ171DRAFT_565432 [Polychytrium aggregatum]